MQIWRETANNRVEILVNGITLYWCHVLTRASHNLCAQCRLFLTCKNLPLEFALLRTEAEERIALEAAGAAAALGSGLGEERIDTVLRGAGREDLRMEAVLILAELGTPFARTQLVRVAGQRDVENSELRQAALWGLGKAGLREYDQLLPFISDADENVAMHAIVAFETTRQKRSYGNWWEIL